MWKGKPCPITVDRGALIRVQGASISFLSYGMVKADAVSLEALSFETYSSGSFATDFSLQPQGLQKNGGNTEVDHAFGQRKDRTG